MRISFAIPAFLVLLPAVSEAQWQGSEVVEGGVLYVINPETPIMDRRVEPAERWRRGGPDDDIVFGRIADIESDVDGNVYVLDAQDSEVHVLSASGEHVRTIGRDGEGPGEFRNAAGMFLGPSGTVHILQMFPPRIVRIAPDGTSMGNFDIPEIDGGFQQLFRGRATRDRILLAGGQEISQADGQKRIKFLRAFDTNGTELAHYHDEIEAVRFDGMRYDEKTWGNLVGRWSVRSDGYVASVLEFDNYRIHVWNDDGTIDRVIERPAFESLERTTEEKALAQERFDRMISWNAGSTISISPSHRSVLALWYRDDGYLWVLSSCGRWGDSDLIVFDVYDDTGRFMLALHLTLDATTEDDRYYLRETGLYRLTTDMELISYSLN